MRRTTFAILLLTALCLAVLPSAAAQPRPSGGGKIAKPVEVPEPNVPNAFCIDNDGDGWYIESGGGCTGGEPVTDCNDNNAAIHPGATESCDGINQNCNGFGDEGYTLYYRDADGDGYGRPDLADQVNACTQPSGFSAMDSDCNDSNASINPGETDDCNGINDDCSGTVDDSYAIGTACDGVGACGAGVYECATLSSRRCSTEPGGSNDQSVAEVCGNSLDDDCDGATDEAAGVIRYVSTSGTDAGNACDVTACATIQHAINVACVGDTVSVAAGSYAENLSVPKRLTIEGAGEGSTTLVPGVSNPNACGGSSLCGCPTPNSSNLILVRASDVRVTGMTLDGDNPSLPGGILVHGANIDARNGIIEDFCPGTPFNNTTINHVTVKNVFLRGIYLSSGGSGFDVNHSTVNNVRASASSIAMFAFLGAGTFDNNTVTNSSDSISANHSRGVSFTNNHVTCDPADLGNGYSGIHTDNTGDSGGTADLIDQNDVTTCDYGVWVFVPYTAPTVSNNTVNDCTIGLGAFGGKFPQGSSPANTVFDGNEVDGSAGSLGAWITTTTFGFGATNVRATLTGNTFRNNDQGVYIGEAEYDGGDLSQSVTVEATENEIESNDVGVFVNASASGLFDFDANHIQSNSSSGITTNSGTTVSAECVWWGSAAGPGAGGNNGVTGSGTVNTAPYDVNTTFGDSFAQYPDTDGDGYGLTAGEIFACGPVAGYVTASGDCNDSVATTYPGAPEVCNGVDDDCDTVVDNGGTRYVAVGGSDTLNDCLDSGTPCATIQRAVNVACAGETVNVNSGAYSENVALDKRLVVAGHGAGVTVVTAASAGSPVFDVSASGLSTSDRLTVRDLTTHGGASGIAISSAAGSFYRFSDMEARSATVAGIRAGTSGTVSDVEVSNANLHDNGQYGLFVPANSMTAFSTLSVTGGSIHDNHENGLAVYGSNTATNVTGINVTGTTFTGNGLGGSAGRGSVILYQFNGDATLSGIDIHCVGGSDRHGLQLRGRGTYPSVAASGSVILSDVNVDGTCDFSSIEIHTYSSVAGISMSGINLTATSPFGLYVEELGLALHGTTLNAGDTVFGGTNGANRTIADVSAADINATNAKFGAVFAATACAGLPATLSDFWPIEDAIGHSINAAGGGRVSVCPAHWFVTPNSFATPLTTAASVQRGVNTASATDTVHVENGSYLNTNINVNKALTIDGESEAGVTLSPDVNDSHAVGTYATPVSQCFVVTASSVTIQDLTIDGTAGTWGYRTGVVTGLTSTVNNLVLQNLHVKNIWRRGLQISSPPSGPKTTGHVIQNNTVESIGMEAAGYGIAIFEGDTQVLDNTVRDSYDGIASNYINTSANAPLLTVQGNTLERVVIGLDISGQANSLLGGPNPGDENSVNTTAFVSGVPWGPYDQIGSVIQYAEGQVTLQRNTFTGNAGDGGVWLYHNDDPLKPVLMVDNDLTSSSATWSVVGDSAGVFVTDDGSFFGDEDAENYATLTKNTITGYKRGVQVHRSGTSPVGGRTLATTIGGATNADANSISAIDYAVLLEEPDGSGNGGRKNVATVTNNRGSFNGAVIGILVDGASATIEGNDILNNSDTGVKIQNDGTATINGNQIAGNANYGVNNLTSPTINAECNYWGASTGPGGAGDDVAGNVDYTAFSTYNDYDEDLDADFYTSCQGDCQPLNVAVNPGAAELCGDLVNNNCDGNTDDTGVGAVTYYRDADADTYGNPSLSQTVCTQPVGYVLNNTDCDDSNANRFPGNAEICANGVDEDCSLADYVGPNVTRYVDDGGPATDVTTNDCTSPGLPCLTIQRAVTLACVGDVVQVADGSHSESISLAKRLTFQGAQWGVDARGRVAAESDWKPAGAGLQTVTLVGGSAGAVFDGFTFRDSTAGLGIIRSTVGPQDGLQIRNNRFLAFTGEAVFLDKPATDVTIERNVVDGSAKTGGSGSIHLDTDPFNGFWLIDNNIVNCASGTTGFFVDGARNVGPSGRNPLIEGNLFNSCGTGANVGKRSLQTATIRNNTFSNIAGDGLQGGPKDSTITRNQFSNNGRGLALTSFSDLGTGRGAINNNITENFFSANATADVFISGVQPAGNVGSNHVNGNSLASATAISHAVPGSGPEIIDCSGNWYGSSTGPTIAGNPGGAGGAILGTGAANINWTPWLHTGTDIAALAPIPGFQGDYSYLDVDDGSPQYGAVLRVQEGLNLGDGSLGGRVNVHDGTYYEALEISKPVWLRGVNGAASTFLNGNSVSGNFYMIFIKSSDVTVNGFDVSNSIYNDGADASGIVNEWSPQHSNIHITNNVVHDIGTLNRPVAAFGTFGINVGPVNGAEVNHNTIYNIANDDASSEATAFLVWGNGCGGADEATNVNAHHNTIHDITHPAFSAGIRYGGGTSNGTLDHNTVTGPIFWGLATSNFMCGPASTPITFNTVTNGTDIGIRVGTPFGATVDDNTVTGGGSGIRVDGSGPGTNGKLDSATRNAIHGAALGINITADADTVGPITVNSFDNTVGFANPGALSPVLACNWWGSATGPNPPGSGDPISGTYSLSGWLLSDDYNTDPDGDTYSSCTVDGYDTVANFGDCNNLNALIHPGAAQLCDGLENTCSVSYPAPPADEVNNDLDTYVECSPWVGAGGTFGGDCNDAVATTHPFAPEACDAVNADCDLDYTEDTTASCNDNHDCTTDVCQLVAGPAGACAYSTNACTLTGNLYYYRDSTDTEGVEGTSTKGVPDVTIDLTGVAIVGIDTDVTSNPNGDYNFSAGGSVTATPQDLLGNETKPGDSYQPGITSADATLIAKFAVNLKPLTDFQKIAGDVSNNGRVTSFDASEVAQWVALTLPEFPVVTAEGSSWAYRPVFRNETVDDSSLVAIDFAGILYGDVTANWGELIPFNAAASTTSSVDSDPDVDRMVETARGAQANALEANGAARHPIRTSGPADLFIASAPVSIGQGEWEVVLGIQNSDGIEGLDLELRSTSDTLKLNQVQTADVTRGMAVAQNAHDDKLRVALFGVEPMRGTGGLVVLHVHAPSADFVQSLSVRAEANEGAIPLRFNSVPVEAPEEK